MSPQPSPSHDAIPVRPSTGRIGLSFTEHMKGRVSMNGEDEYETGYERGDEVEFTLTVGIEDLDRMLADPAHEAGLSGTVKVPSVSEGPLNVIDGHFNLFVPDPTSVGTRKMIYRMRLQARDGREYFFDGFKLVRDDPGVDLWADTTTLYVTLYDGPGDQAPLLGKGVMRIGAADLARLLTTVNVWGAGSPLRKLEAIYTFGEFFAGRLVDTYGQVIRKPNALNPEAPPRPRERPLRLPEPEEHWIRTRDGMDLRLTRYAPKEPSGSVPVLMAPGFSMSRSSFLVDTIEENLSEFLHRRGFDVWLFDYRCSPDLRASESQFTIDDIAEFDWPAAVAKVKEVTGCESVRALGHCVGSVSLLMSLLEGLEGVQTAVCSQYTVHVRQAWYQRFMAQVRAATILKRLGIRYLSSEFTSRSGLGKRLFDLLLRFYPTRETCRSPVCRRILFLYGEVFRHDQLNRNTHEAIHEMFGVGNLTAFKHMLRMTRKRRAVDHRGRDVYLPQVDRLARTRVVLLQGRENGIFKPKGTLLTQKWLAEHFGEAGVQRWEFQGYGHLDLFIGRDANSEVFPVIADALGA